MATRAMLVYDGDCGFCSTCARLLLRWVRSPAQVVPWQRLDLAALGITEQQADESVQWVDPAGHRSSGALAFAHFLQSATSPWSPWRQVGRLLALGRVQKVAQPVYAWISRHRHRMPGGTPACRFDPPR